MCRKSRANDLELALQIADTVWLMAEGKDISIGTPRELADAGVLSTFIEQKGIGAATEGGDLNKLDMGGLHGYPFGGFEDARGI